MERMDRKFHGRNYERNRVGGGDCNYCGDMNVALYTSLKSLAAICIYCLDNEYENNLDVPSSWMAL